MVRRRTLLVGAGALAGLGVVGVSGCSGSPSLAGIRIGMAGYPWEIRLGETGPVQVRRTFESGSEDPQTLMRTVRQDRQERRTSVVSIKVPSWGDAASGALDDELSTVADLLDAQAHDVCLAIHHEPSGDGDTDLYAAMQARLLPVLKRPYVKVCVIVNGFWFSHHPERQPLTDADIARWLPEEVLAACDVVAADCYHGGTLDDPGREPDEQILGLLEWSDRVGHGKTLGLGEFSGHTASAIENVGRVLGENRDRFAWACIYNSNRNNRAGVQWALTGDRLAAFKALLAASRDSSE